MVLEKKIVGSDQHIPHQRRYVNKTVRIWNRRFPRSTKAVVLQTHHIVLILSILSRFLASRGLVIAQAYFLPALININSVAFRRKL